jgi:hypothetical protein
MAAIRPLCATLKQLLGKEWDTVPNVVHDLIERAAPPIYYVRVGLFLSWLRHAQQLLTLTVRLVAASRAS